MILDHLTRRGFLQAGVAAGGGLMLSLSLPFASGEAEAADADGFTPNAFIRLDAPAKVNGTAVYGIDVRPPGVKIATLAQALVFGGG